IGPILGPAPSAIGTATYDVTATVQAWSNAPATNFGWIFIPLSNQQIWVRGSETVHEAERPKLTVTYSSTLACSSNAQCSDGNACTGTETCVNSVCNPGASLNCNDGNPCTNDSCNPASGCAHVNNASSCSDGNVCTDGDRCVAGPWVAGAARAWGGGSPG